MADIILILEDDPQVVETIQVMFSDEGYDLIIPSEFGEQALAQASIIKPDLALVDLQLPGTKITGLDTIAYLHGRFPGIKIIVVSGHHGWRETSLAAGANAFLGKPFKKAELLGVVKQVLES